MSGADTDVQLVEPKNQPAIGGLENLGSSTGSTNLTTLSPASPETPKPASPRILKSSSHRMEKPKSDKKNKVGQSFHKLFQQGIYLGSLKKKKCNTYVYFQERVINNPL